jgi:GMP synthase (glutamine-hydrolysing)
LKSKTVTAVRHVNFEDLGIFADTFVRQGYSICYFDVGVNDLARIDAHDSTILVVLGGPIGAYETEQYPFLRDELRLIETHLHHGIPTLGICLGAQLIARALGADVYPGQQKELGWAKIKLSSLAAESAVRHFENVPVLHWHGDTFDLPTGAELLASTELFPNQAFSVGRNVLAFQFHPELSPMTFERWLIGHVVEIAAMKGVTVAGLRSDTARFAGVSAECGKRCLSDWLATLEADN